MTAAHPEPPQHLRLLATHLAGRALAVAESPGAAHTDGRVVFVSAGATPERQRREVLLHAALLGAGSLDPARVAAMRGRPSVARRYLALEGHRVLAALAPRVPLAAALSPGDAPTAGAEESLRVARGRTRVADPPDWFGVITPSRLISAPPGPGGPATEADLQFELRGDDPLDDGEDGDQDDQPSGDSRILKLFESPVALSQGLADALRKMFGSSRSPGDGAAGADMRVRSAARSGHCGPDARPAPVRIRFADDRPGATVGIGGARYPEWDVFADRYREQWCRVIDFPLRTDADVAAADVVRDDVLRARLARVGVGPRVFRARADGDELDIEALTGLFVDLRSGYSPPEHVYLERRPAARNLGVLVLLDASGSASDSDVDGLAVHEHQRRAAGVLAATLEELGDRVAVYAFRSQGREAVHLPAIKTFEQRFTARARARLHRLTPSGYTRLGAAIRGAGEILKRDAGTTHRLLLVLSDGVPYDAGYEGRYAEADSRRALAELRADGVACLCLTIGAATRSDALQRVFGSVGYARAATLAHLSPRMDQLFVAALRELAAPAGAAR
ncbi:VWA domain-containing protein [Mycobacterium sp. MYCO198283]|uniref:nitric oxide reductase activation protein NorD n=1 Tax=Mycobacterium sp. MYCO198283 TaxID=2883505 RepID=UPI001E5984F1|nr:VWA domain-containing protein [Mycobacterium sp. MYCO198283]MCG5434186.1 VWA domain-containing protein [Mycobacterium sp. MYCO198283]